MEEISFIPVIDELIRQKRPFALYRLPGEKTSRFLMQSEGDVRIISTLEALNEQKGFVVAPFRASAGCPVVLIQPDIFSLKDFDLSQVGEVSCIEPVKVPHDVVMDDLHGSYWENYVRCFDVFIGALHKEQFAKLVLSRKQEMYRSDGFSPAAAFYNACERYIYSYVYLCYTPQTGLWLGSTPELILSGEQGAWHTVALAGTQSVQNGELPRQWDEKNRKEQAYVSSYIRDQLLSFDIHPQEEGPYPVFAGALSHLRTDFRFALPGNNDLGSLLQLLHPTPAVCGLPKEEAYRFILENEGYDRRYYSGFIGWLDPEGKTDLYVNLRCMSITHDTLSLYAGGGLLSSSTLDDEWQETEKKMLTMRRLFEP